MLRRFISELEKSAFKMRFYDIARVVFMMHPSKMSNQPGHTDYAVAGLKDHRQSSEDVATTGRHFLGVTALEGFEEFDPFAFFTVTINV